MSLIRLREGMLFNNCIALRNAVIVKIASKCSLYPLLAAAVGCVDECLKEHVTYCVILTFWKQFIN